MNIRLRGARLATLVLGGACAAGVVQAQTCTAPITFSTGAEISGNTCLGGTYPPSLGPIASPHRKLVYRFDAAAIADRRLRFDAPDFEMAAFVSTSCDPAVTPLAVIELAPGQSGDLVLPAALSGPHYLLVTASPVSPYETCGNFAFSDLDPRIITDAAEFRGLLEPGYYLEGFRTLPRGATPQRIDFTNGTYGYTATPYGAQAQLIVPTDALGRPLQALAVRTGSGTGTLRLTLAGAPVNAFGGRFWKTALPLFSPQGSLTVSLRSGTRVTAYTIVGTSDFRGFYSPRPIEEIAISALGSGRPTVDDLIVGQILP